MDGRVRIRVDHGLCVGNAMCVALAPGAFAHNADRQSEPLDPYDEAVDTILDAAASCPTGAIRVEDAGTGEWLFPPRGS